MGKTCLNCRPNLAKRVAGKFCCLVIENWEDMSESRRFPSKRVAGNFVVAVTWLAKNTRAKMRIAAFTLEQVIFSLKSQKNLFPKLFQKAVTWLAGNTRAKMSTAAFTLEQVIFSLKSKKNLFPKLFRPNAWVHKENMTSD